MPQRPFLDLSIKQQLYSLGLFASLVALLLACIALFTYDSITFKENMVSRLGTVADMVGYNTASAIAFNDPAAAARNLEALKGRTGILAAGIYGANGELFVSYSTDPEKFPLSPALNDNTRAWHTIDQNGLTLVQPIILNNAPIGAVFIRSDLLEQRQRLTQYALILVCVLLVSALLAGVVSSYLGQRVSAPIMHLIETAKKISDEKIYSVRATRMGEGEIRALAQTFNEMLSQIQERGEALQAAHDQLEKRVEERTAELEASNRELESFSYSVSHDLRTPLRAIDGYSQMVTAQVGDKLDEENRLLLGKIRDNIARMAQLIDDLLAFSRLGRQPVQRQPIAMKELAESVVAELMPDRPNLPQIHIHDMDPVRADASMVRQALLNLVSNAFKFTSKKLDARIDIGMETMKGESVYYVKDNGAGFDMAYKDKLFGVFQRLHSPNEFQGTGVGLAIVQRIIQKQGGRVWADAKVDKGAAFYFTLPQY